MRNISRLFIFFMILFIQSHVHAQCTSDTPHPDYATLMALYESTDGSNWTNNDGWREGAAGEDCDPCNGLWVGLTCENGRVTRILFESNNLSGPLPIEIEGLSKLKELRIQNGSLSGSIPKEIGILSDLEIVHLDKNFINGPIPSEIGNLSKLRSLILSNNELNGPLPSSIGNLSMLSFLSIEDNNLEGQIPASFWFLTNLNLISLSSNNLTGHIPLEISNLTNLTYLFLSDNSLTGSIPNEICNLSNLQSLFIGDNDITGEIPSCIGDLTNLTKLWLRNNDLSGQIPTGLFDIKNLVELFLDRNQLEGLIAPEISNLDNLFRLVISDNNFSGDISFLCDLPSLEIVGGDRNNFNGNIPQCILGTDKFRYISFISNKLAGCYPESDITLCDLGDIDFRFSNNPGLPWNGDLGRYCEESTQIGAPCTTPDGEAAEITAECNCEAPLPCESSFDIGPTDPKFRPKRCLFQPAYDQEIRDNEAILIKNPIPKRKYIFSFCEGYSPSNFEAKISIVEYDRETSSIGQLIFENSGCYHEFKVPEDLDYTDILIIVKDTNDCNSESQEIENGKLVFKCGIGRN